MRTLIFFVSLFISFVSVSQTSYLFIGGYTHAANNTPNGSQGIYVYRFDEASGKLQWVSNTEGIINPSFLVIAPGAKNIYACTDTRTANAGSISAFAFDRKNGNLKFINKQPGGGDNPVYITIDKKGRWVVNGNYTGGSLAALPINPDGSLQPLRQSIQHTGSSINKSRQDKPHVHATVFSPADDYLFVPDLGLDKVVIYHFKPSSENPLEAVSPVLTTPGSGPRHFTFHPNGKYAYLVEEISGTVVAYKYKNGKLDSLQRLETHPPEIKEGFSSADIHTSPDGKFLYVSNRGNENTITIYSIDQSTGMLTLKGYQSTLGKTPRNFTIDPSGKFLLVANQTTGNIVVFRRNMETGMLAPTGEEIKIPEPSCLKMIR